MALEQFLDSTIGSNLCCIDSSKKKEADLVYNNNFGESEQHRVQLLKLGMLSSRSAFSRFLCHNANGQMSQLLHECLVFFYLASVLAYLSNLGHLLLCLTSGLGFFPSKMSSSCKSPKQLVSLVIKGMNLLSMKQWRDIGSQVHIPIPICLSFDKESYTVHVLVGDSR